MTDANNDPKINQSAKTLLWLAGILMLTGMAVMSPAAGLFCFALAALSAGAAILLSRGTVRIVSIIMTAAALIMVGVMYPAYKTHMDQYRLRISEGRDASK